MKTVLTLLSVSLISSFAWGSASTCGFDSRSQLLQESRQTLETFQGMKNFNPLFFEKRREKNGQTEIAFAEARATLAQRETKRENYNQTQTVLADMIAQLRRDPRLAPIAERSGYLMTDFNVAEKCGGAPACVTYGEYSIVVSEQYFESLKSRLGASASRIVMNRIVAHEIGHYVFDIQHTIRGGYASFAEAMRTLNPLRYHVAVDGISMVLTNTGIDEYVTTLEASIEGQTEVGDIPDRIRCLRSLR